MDITNSESMQPLVSRQLVATVIPGQVRLAVLEDEKLVEYYVERPGKERSAGNIYKGKVVNVLPGMDAAFVDIGLERNAFLYVGDIALDKENFKFKNNEKTVEIPDIKDVLKEGENIIVQVVKDPLGTKGARITTHVTLPGRMLVLMPTMDYIGVSRRIEDENERERLKSLAQDVCPDGMGLIIRTVAEGCDADELKGEIIELNNLWLNIQKYASSKNPPCIIHRDNDLLLRAIRDLCSDFTQEFIINDRAEYNRITEIAANLAPNWPGTISYYDGDIFTDMDIEKMVDKTFSRRIWLKNGAYLIVDHTEALTVIDVNSGKYVGTHNLQDTIIKVNKEAAAEIARQVRLRDIGGIIIIDFIDMADEDSKAEIVAVLEDELKKDRTRTNVVGMTGLGLVEMTRKKIRQRVATMMHKTCPYCHGSGRVINEETIALKILREFLNMQRESPSQKYILKVHSDVADYIENEKLLPDIVEIYRSRSAHVEYYKLSDI
ncbi:MAG: Rne/Rng family ribonuclease [Clostridia bacterium]|nr:Rne/Rng family ribonuclease [Clostridia bacterium]